MQWTFGWDILEGSEAYPHAVESLSHHICVGKGNMAERKVHKAIKYFLPKWGINVILTRTDEGFWWVLVTALCEELGIQAARQRQRLQTDPRFKEHVDFLYIKLDGVGIREVFCIRRNRVGDWFNLLLSSVKVAPKFQGNMDQLRRDVIACADRAVWGDGADVMDPVEGAQDHLTWGATPSGPQILHVDAAHDLQVSIVRGELHIDCPRCGAAICITLDGSGNHVLAGTRNDD